MPSALSGGNVQKFEIKTGLKQGDALFPVLFYLALEQVIRDMKDNKSMKLVGNRTLLYSLTIYTLNSDDIVILGEYQDQIISSTLNLMEAN